MFDPERCPLCGEHPLDCEHTDEEIDAGHELVDARLRQAYLEAERRNFWPRSRP